MTLINKFIMFLELIQFPFVPLDIYLKKENNIFKNELLQETYVYKIRNEFLEIWSQYFSIQNISNEFEFFEICKRMLLYQFLCKNNEIKNYISPCYFIGKDENNNFFYVENKNSEKEEEEEEKCNFDKIEFLKMFQYLKNECGFEYGNSKLYFDKNNFLINFSNSSFYLNGERIDSEKNKKDNLNLFFELFEINNTIDYEILNYLETLLLLRKNIGFDDDPLDDYLLIFQFLKYLQIFYLENVNKKYISFVVNYNDEKLYNNLLKIKNGIERFN